MYQPTWHRPRTVHEASRILAEEGGRARVIAGGTDLAVQIASGAERPEVLVDLGLVSELSSVDSSEGRVRVGATVTHATLASHPVLLERASVLAEAGRFVGSPHIRCRGTIGGNVANASPAADATAALLALDAVALVRSAGGDRRDVPLEAFFEGPGETVLETTDLLEGFEFDLPREGARSVYLKAGQRNALAIAIVSVAAVFNPLEGSVRLALGSVAPTPVRAEAAERLFAEEWRGCSPSVELLGDVASKVVEATSCIDDVRARASYRRRLAAVLARRALGSLCAE